MSYAELGARVERVRERIAAACARAGRPEGAATLVAVTKTHPPAAAEAALAVGVADLAENRVQELESKIDALGTGRATWHLIGTLQRNKARRALALADLIHSVDSTRLATKLSEDAAAEGAVARILVQVNVAGEETKGGFAPDEAIDRLGEICALPGLRVEGLMTMAPFVDDERVLRAAFARTREISDQAARQIAGFHPLHLSMGMSNDFELAVEEGSTLVRLGTILFGEREP